jgi:hypothetical protein
MNALGKPLECGTIDTQYVKHDLFLYGQHMHSFFKKLLEKYWLETSKTPNCKRDNKEDRKQAQWIIGVEDYAPKFNKNSSAHTLFKLSNCNVLCCYEAQNVLQNVEIIRSNVISARSLFKIGKSNNLDSGKDSDIKYQVFNALQTALPSSYSIQYFKRGGEMNISPKNFDVTDSLLISLYSFVVYHTRNIASNMDDLLLFSDKVFSDTECTVSKNLRQFYQNEMERLQVSGVDKEDLGLVASQSCLHIEDMKAELETLFIKQLQSEVVNYLRELLDIQREQLQVVAVEKTKSKRCGQ